jgi:hypothetical protein
MAENYLSGVLDDTIGFIQQNAVPVAVGVGVVSAGVIGTAVALSRRSSKKRSKRTSKSKGRSRDRMFISKQKHERRYKRKTKGRKYKSHKKTKSSKRGIKYTKNGQPYKIMANGRARFIKK